MENYKLNALFSVVRRSGAGQNLKVWKQAIFDFCFWWLENIVKRK